MYFNRVTTRIVNLDLNLSLVFYNILIFAYLIHNIVNYKTIRIFNKLWMYTDDIYVGYFQLCSSERDGFGSRIFEFLEESGNITKNDIKQIFLFWTYTNKYIDRKTFIFCKYWQNKKNILTVCTHMIIKAKI